MKNKISKYICILCSVTLLFNSQAFALMTDDDGGGDAVGYSGDGNGLNTYAPETPSTLGEELSIGEDMISVEPVQSAPVTDVTTVTTTPDVPTSAGTANMISDTEQWKLAESLVNSGANPSSVAVDYSSGCVINENSTWGNGYTDVYEPGVSKPFHIEQGSAGEELLKSGMKPSEFIGKTMYESNGYAYHIDSTGLKSVGPDEAAYNSSHYLKPASMSTPSDIKELNTPLADDNGYLYHYDSEGNTTISIYEAVDNKASGIKSPHEISAVEASSNENIFTKILKGLGFGGSAAVALTVNDTKAEASDLKEKAKTTTAGKNAKSGKISTNRKDTKKVTTKKKVKAKTIKKASKNLPKINGATYTSKKINGKEYDVIIKNGKIVYSRNKKTGKVNVNKVTNTTSSSGYSFGEYKSTINRLVKKIKAGVVSKKTSAKKANGVSTKNSKKKSKKAQATKAKTASGTKKTKADKTKKASQKKNNKTPAQSNSGANSGKNSAAKPVSNIRTGGSSSGSKQATLTLPRIATKKQTTKLVTPPKVKTSTPALKAVTTARAISSTPTAKVTGGTIPRPNVVKPSVKTGRLMTV